MSPEAIAHLQQLIAAATPGPVEVHRNDQGDGSIAYQVQSYGPRGNVVCNHSEHDSKRARADAALHAALRNAAPELLASHEKYTLLVEMANSHHEQWATVVVVLEALSKELKRRNEPR